MNSLGQSRNLDYTNENKTGQERVNKEVSYILNGKKVLKQKADQLQPSTMMTNTFQSNMQQTAGEIAFKKVKRPRKTVYNSP